MFLVISVVLASCDTNHIDYTLARASGNKPAQFFYFSNPSDANNYRFHHKVFDIDMLQAYQKDWKLMGGWSGAFIYGGIGIALDIKEVNTIGDIFSYGINITTYKDKVGEHQRAVMRRDVGWYRRKFPMREYQKNEIGAIDLHFETKGKEGYTCVVSDYINTKRGIKGKVYNCYKFNPNKTKYTKVQIELIYNKAPNLPKKYKHLAKQYTYADLKRRAKRMLDSLYIKDGW